MNWKLIRIIDSLAGIPLIRLISLFVRPRRSGTLRSADGSPQKILLVKFWGIGNIFMMIPSIRALQDTFPKAEFDFLTLENNRDALTTLKLFNRITTIDTSSVLKFFGSWKAAVNDLTAARYDIAIDFDQFARFSALITFQAGAHRSIGFSTIGQHRHHLYSSTVEYDDHMHITRSFYSLVAAAGVRHPFSVEIRLDNMDTLRSIGMRLLQDHGISRNKLIAVMHIGTSHNFKERRWSPAQYAALADLLAERFGMLIVMTGLPDETILIAEAKQHLKHARQVLDLGGRLSFSDYFALMSVADLVISADTATVHIASAVNTPAVGFYGPNTPHLYGPWRANGLALYSGFDCSPCITNFNGKIHTCRHPEGRGACMNAITVERAFKEIEDHYLRARAPWLLQKLKESPV